MPNKDILLSLKPRHAQTIFTGLKTVELRKRRPNIKLGTRIWIYVSLPTGAIKGSAKLSQLESNSPKAIWKKLGHQTGVSKQEFNGYFQNSKTAHALILTDVRRLAHDLSLKDIKKKIRSFHPPQFFFHLNGTHKRLKLSSRKSIKIKR
jgi:predicted transcriptional regulator